MKTGERGVIVPCSALTSALAGGKWSASCLVTLCPWKDPALPLYRGLGGHQSWLEHFGQKKYLLVPPGIEFLFLSCSIYGPEHIWGKQE
jgi:hypothetical protein